MRDRERERDEREKSWNKILILFLAYCYNTILHLRWYCSTMPKNLAFPNFGLPTADHILGLNAKCSLHLAFGLPAVYALIALLIGTSKSQGFIAPLSPSSFTTSCLLLYFNIKWSSRIHLRLCLVGCKIFSKCKIFLVRSWGAISVQILPELGGLDLAGRPELGVGLCVELRLVRGLELKWGWCVCVRSE